MVSNINPLVPAQGVPASKAALRANLAAAKAEIEALQSGKSDTSHTHTLAGITNAGTAAGFNVGTSANNVVQLDGSAQLPAVNGSQLTNLTVGTTGVTNQSGVTGTTASDALNTLNTAMTEVNQDVVDLCNAIGIAENVQHLGTVAGGIVADNSTVKAALIAIVAAILTKSPITQSGREFTGATEALVLGDAGNSVIGNSASAQLLTVPLNSAVPYPICTRVDVYQRGAGIVTVRGGTGVTVNGVSAGGASLLAQYTAVTLLLIATDTWIMAGAHGIVS